MRGQASLDFLATYGWAILIMLAAVGVLVSMDVFAPENKLPDQMTISDGFVVEAAGITRGGGGATLVVGLKNVLGSEITLDKTDSYCERETGISSFSEFRDETAAYGNEISSVSSGERFTYVCAFYNGYPDSIKKDKIDFTISYKLPRNTYPDVAKGTIVTSIRDGSS